MLLLELLLHLLGRKLRLRRSLLRLLISCLLLDDRTVIEPPVVLLGALLNLLLNRLLELPDWQLLLLSTEPMRHLISVDLLRNRLLLLRPPGRLALLRVHLLKLMQLHCVHDHVLLYVIRQIPKTRL